MRLLLAFLVLFPLGCGTPTPVPPPEPPPAAAPVAEAPTGPAIRIQVRPTVGIPPLERVKVEILIPRHPDNRKYDLEVDGPGLYSLTEESIAGSAAPFLYVRYILHFLENGKYEVRARLYRAPEPSKVFDEAYDVVTMGGMSIAGLTD